jgi:hypothetical protein
VTGPAEDRLGGSVLDEATRIQDGGLIGELGHDREVVADVHGRHLMLGGECAHGLEDTALGGDIQPCRGLVENDDSRPAAECHRDANPLLLPTRHLVRVAVQKGVGRR